MSNTVDTSSTGRLTIARAKESLVRWYVVPVTLGVLGVLIGGIVAAIMLKPTAETLVTLNSQQLDATSMARASETMVQQMRTEAVFTEASRALGLDADPQQLRTRTRIAAVPSTMVISVQVVAEGNDDRGQAVAEAEAIVNAVQTIEDNARAAELERVTASIRELMTSKDSKVSDAQAEQTRVTRLGGALADSQASVATMARQLTVVQPSRLTSGTVSPLALAFACGLGGALLGAGVALLLGAHRGGVRSMEELSSIHPNLPVITPAALPEVLAVEGNQISTIIVTGTSATRHRLQALCDQVAFTLFSDPRQSRDLNLLVAPLHDAVVRRVADDPSVIVLVGVDVATLRLEEVGRQLDRMPSRTYLTELPETM